MKRKMTVLLLIAVMLLSVLGTTAMAAEPVETTVSQLAATSPRAESQIKLMTFNVLNNNSGSTTITGSLAQRAALIAQMIATYTPDVIGFQEAGDGGTNYNAWEQQLRAKLTGYSGLRSFSDNEADVYNGQMIFYRSDKYQYVSSGHEHYKAYDSNDTKSSRGTYEWAVLKERSTGITFYVFNTHWPINTHTTLDYNIKMRAAQIPVLNSAIERIAGANPVFILGDFNCSFVQKDNSTTDGTNFAKFLNSKGYCDGLKNAPVKNASTSTIDKCIDHVVYHPSTATPVEAVYIKRDAFNNANANAMSDHPAVMVTLNFYGHVHAVDSSCSTTSGTQKAFDALNSTGGTLAAGNYYLPADIEALTSNLVVSSGTVNLCLNGHTLHSKKMHIEVTGGTLNICDCDGSNGFIYGWNADGNGIIHVNGGTVNLYNGTVKHSKSASAVQSEGCDVNKIRSFCVEKGTLNIYGGAVKNVTGNAITVGNGKLTVGGNAIVTGGYHAISNSGTTVVNSGTISNPGSSVSTLYNLGTATVNNGATITGLLPISNGSSSTNAILNITGGTINCTESYAIKNNASTATVNLSGAPEINSGIADFYLRDSSTITPTAAVTGGPYTILTETAPTTAAPVKITSGWTTYNSSGAVGDVFVSANVNYATILNNSEVYLSVHSAHTVVTDAAVPATCTQAGLSAGSHCSVCNTVITAQEEIPALGHDLVADAAVAATCTESGLTAGEHCSCCDYAVAQEIIPALGHDMIADAAVPATCTETGLSAGQHCSRCDAATVVQEIVPALGHDYTSEVTTEATCLTAGVKTYTCTRCNDSYTEEIPVVGHEHSYTAVVTAPTCTATGYTTHTCEGCGDSYVTDEIPALGHSYTEEVLSAPTCTLDGSMRYTCANCTDSYTEVLPATGHSYTTEVTAPTCTEQGYTTHFCAACGDSYADSCTEALGHSYREEILAEATCTENGVVLFTCETCNDIYAERLPMLEHELQYADNGDGTHRITCSSCDLCETTAHSFTDGVCVCGAEEREVKITSAAPRLDADIDLLYTAAVPEGATNVYMVFTMHGTETRVEDDGTHTFLFEGVTPQCMGDNISAALHAEYAGREYTDNIGEYSVRQYCVNMLSRYPEDTALQTMLSDLLTYGAAAQNYADYKTATLVTSDLALTPSTYSAISGCGVAFDGEKAAAADWTSAGLILSNDLAVRFVFRAESVENLSVAVSINGRTETYTAEDFEAAGSGRYCIEFRGIKATEFGDTVSASFLVNGKQVGRTVSYSVNAYICSTQNCENASLRSLVRALYNYGASAKAYKK